MELVAEKYKQTDIGVFPNDWEIKRLGDIAIVEGGFAFKSKNFIQDGEYQIIKMSNLYQGDLDLTRSSSFLNSLDEIEKHYLLTENEILITLTGTVGKKDYGYTYRIKSDKNLLLNQRVARIISKEDINPVYLDFHIKTDTFLYQFFDASRGGTGNQTNVGTKDVEEIFIPVPPTKTEQTAIATALSDADALITSLEKLIAKKQNIKQGAMQHLLRPKENWVVKKLGEVFTFYSTSNFSKAQMAFEGEVGCVHYGLVHAIVNTSYSLSKGIKYYVTKEQAHYETIQEGDVIMVDASEDLVGLNKSVEVFDVGNKKYIAGLHTFLLRDENSIYVNKLRGVILNSTFVKNQMIKLAVGMKVFGVSKPQLQNVLIPIPPPEEQTQIATILSDMDAEIATLEKRLAKAQNIKQAMMQQLLTGKIRLV